ncbi:MAG: tripartite tricarboxylate transporter substrate binding protein, partial [Burkholderiales bacterium]
MLIRQVLSRPIPIQRGTGIGHAIRLIGALLVATLATATVAQDYPTRPVRIVVASVPGSAPDVLARLIAEPLAARLKQPVLVENRAGAGGIIGVDSVAKSSPDGHTLVVGHDGTMAFSTTLHKKLPYDPIADFAPITALATNEFVLVANATVPIRTFAEFLVYAKARSGRTSYGSAGVGTPNQLILEQLAQSANFSMVHVPYKGGAAAVADLVGGQIDFMMAGLAPALPHIRAGKLTALAVPQSRRSGALPDVPSIGETLNGFATKSWFGLFAPHGVPADIVTRLNREVRA